MPLPGSGAGYRPSEFVMPLVGHLAENSLAAFDEFREGNDSPGAGNLDFIKACCARMPEGKRIGSFRSDSAAYQASVFNFRMFELKVLPDPKRKNSLSGAPTGGRPKPIADFGSIDGIDRFFESGY